MGLNFVYSLLRVGAQLCLCGRAEVCGLFLIKINLMLHRNPKNPEKHPLTANQPTRAIRWAQKQSSSPFDNEESRFSILRPHTTPLINRPINETLNTTGRSSNFVHMRSVSAVESELQDRYQEDMSSYLRNKLHKIVEKKQEVFIPDGPFNATIDSTDFSTRNRQSKNRRPLDYFYTSFNNESRVEAEKGVDEAYLLTAKERIIRLIEMKKQQESQFRTLSSKIKTKSTLNSELKCKNRLEQFKKETIQEEDWDKKWRESVTGQNKRYRNRLLVKCNKQNNMFQSIQH